MEKSPKVSVVMSARNEQPHIEKTIRSMVNNTNYSNYEIIALNDNSTDNTEAILGNLNIPNVKTFKSDGLGTARARNLAFKYSKGDLVLFCDAHITMTPGWLEQLIDISENIDFDVLSIPMKPDPTGYTGHNIPGYAQTLDENLKTKWLIYNPKAFIQVPIAPGGCALYKREVFKKIGGYDKGFNSWGYEDVEISIKAWLMGYQTKVAYNMCIDHYFRLATPYKVDPVDFFYNYIRTAYLHFSQERIEKLKRIIFEPYGYNSGKQNNIVDGVMKKINESDALRQREIYFAKRKYNDDWFFKVFDINF